MDAETRRLIAEADRLIGRDLHTHTPKQRSADFGLHFRTTENALVDDRPARQPSRQTDDRAWAADWTRFVDSCIDARMDIYLPFFAKAMGEGMAEYFHKRFAQEIAPLKKEIAELKEELGSLRADFNVESTTRRAQIVDLPAFAGKRSNAA